MEGPWLHWRIGFGVVVTESLTQAIWAPLAWAFPTNRVCSISFCWVRSCSSNAFCFFSVSWIRACCFSRALLCCCSRGVPWGTLGRGAGGVVSVGLGVVAINVGSVVVKPCSFFYIMKSTIIEKYMYTIYSKI